MSQIERDIRRYIELRHQIADLEAEIDSLKPAVFGHVHSAGGKLEFGALVFRCALTRSWNYSDVVAELRTRMKERKRDEINRGIATLKKETRYVTMQPLQKAGGDRAGSRREDRSNPQPEGWASARS